MSMIEKSIVLLLLLINLVLSERIFVIDRKDVVYVNKKLKWNEAASTCKTDYDGDLLMIEDQNFGALLISNLKNVTKNIWIGERFKNNTLLWKNSEKSHRTDTKLQQCLSLNLVDEFSFNFTNFSCEHRKEFLCERKKLTKVTLVKNFSIKKHDYAIFEGHSTWYEAVDVCTKRDSRLLTLSKKTVKELSHVFSSHVLLDIALVWVGAVKDHNKWIWISTGDLLPHQAKKGQTEECLSFDVQNNKYRPLNCTKTLSFICETSAIGDFYETCTHQEVTYEFHPKKVPWEVARKICLSKNAFLGNIGSVADANEVASDMENSWETLPIVWIGAKSDNKSGTFTYTWYDTKKTIPTKKDITGYPPWLRNYAEPSTEICVGLLNKNKNGRFVIDFCDQAHGFLCQKRTTSKIAQNMPNKGNFALPDSSARGILKFQINNRHFHSYQNPQNWYGASKTCKIIGCKLFLWPDPNDVVFFKNYTSGNIWLNGIYEGNQWRIGNTPNPNVVAFDKFLKLPITNSTIKKTCLTATFNNKKPTFKAHLCRNRLPFVCECNSVGELKVTFQEHEYLVINKRLTWHEASAVCKARKKDLALTYDIEEAKFLARLSSDYGDLWLGAKKHGKTWTWMATNEILPNRINKINSYPPWHDKKTKLPFACLSIGLIKQKETFKQSACNEQKGFICEKLSPTKDDSLQPRISIIDDKEYRFYPQKTTWKEAFKACEGNFGFLALVPNLKTAQEIASLTYGHPEVWVGGLRKNTKWIWPVSGENIQVFENGQIQWNFENDLDFFNNRDKNYLGLNRANPRIPIFTEKSGEEKLGYVCEKAYNTKTGGFLVETFKIDGNELIFYEKRLNYTDAYDFCVAKNSVLVTADSKNIFKFIEIRAKKFHGVWLGATLTLPNSKFMWNEINRKVTEEIFSPDGFVTNPKWRQRRQIPLDEYTYNDNDDFLQYDWIDYDNNDDENQKIYYYDSEIYDIKKNLQKRSTDIKKGRIKVTIKYQNGTLRNKRNIRMPLVNNANINTNAKKNVFGTLFGKSKTNFVSVWRLKTKNTKKHEFKHKLIKCLKMDETGRLIGLSCATKQSFVCENREYP